MILHPFAYPAETVALNFELHSTSRSLGCNVGLLTSVVGQPLSPSFGSYASAGDLCFNSQPLIEG